MDGDLTSWSIGGPPPNSLLGSIGFLGAPQGLSGSHNKYEGDGSPTRPDLYVAYAPHLRRIRESLTNKSQWQQLQIGPGKLPGPLQ